MKSLQAKQVDIFSLFSFRTDEANIPVVQCIANISIKLMEFIQ